MYIEFTIRHDLDVDVHFFSIEGKEFQIDDSDLEVLIEDLKKIDGFYISDHRTEVFIRWKENGTMDIEYRYYTEPETGKFEENQIMNVPSIPFNPDIDMDTDPGFVKIL